MADILLTHSYHLLYDAKQSRKMQPYRPLGTLYAAAALREAGFSVAVFDTMLSDPEEGLPAAVAYHRPKIVAVYEDDFNFLTKMCLTRMREVAREIASVAGSIGAETIVHGSDATDHPELFLDYGFGYVLRGEAEQTLVELCTALLRGKSVGDISGMVYRDDAGSVVYSREQLSKNASWVDLPEPPLDWTDIATYRHAWTEIHGYFSVNMVSSRGCPYRCNWCAKPISGNKFHLRPAAAVAQEMQRLKTEAHVDHIWFGDDVFALNRDWVQEFAREVQLRDAAVPFKIQSRADLMNETTVSALKTAGCAEVWMGVESGSQKILDAMDKGLKLSAVFTARERLKAAGIRACYFLQFGYPGETWEDLQQTIHVVRTTRPDDIGISFSYPLPGTVFYEKVKAQLGQKQNWTDSDDLCMMFQAAYSDEFYRAIREALHAEADTWPADANVSAEEHARIQRLWARVHQLEPTSRNLDALEPADMRTSSAPVFLPLEQLATRGA